jgi:hypothetical protein
MKVGWRNEEHYRKVDSEPERQCVSGLNPFGE